MSTFRTALDNLWTALCGFYLVMLAAMPFETLLISVPYIPFVLAGWVIYVWQSVTGTAPPEPAAEQPDFVVAYWD